MESFDNYIKLEYLQFQKSPYVKSRSLSDWIIEIQSELNELKIAINNEDKDNIVEELGDVFSDIIHSIIKAENLNYCTLDQVINNIYDKITRRKPWLLDDEPPKTIEDELLIWNYIKTTEK